MQERTHSNENGDSCLTKLDSNVDVAAWMRFVQQLGLPDLFAGLEDKRRQTQVTYTLSSLVMWAFSVCAFRQGSKNAMQTSIESVPAEQLQGVLKLLGIDGESVPHTRTVDEALSSIEFEKFNDILIELFHRAVMRKLFYNHPELTPAGSLQIGVDGYWIHHYIHPHSVDEKGCNCCPHCLPRVHNRDKPNETTTWVHVVITFVLICESLTLPLYVYPLKSLQVKSNLSDDKFKEECELVAARAVLPEIRKKYPRLSMTFFGDALYANRPFIRLCQELGLDYIIVLKEGTLKTVVRQCNELAKTEVYQKHYNHQEKVQIKNQTYTRQASWFNTVAVGENIFTNVLRFKEQDSNRVTYEGAWICSKKIFCNNCFKMAARGRCRWYQEDLHNSCKNRGFDIRHDMARSNPNLLFIYKILVFIAFFVFELFRSTTLAKIAQGTRSYMKFAKDMFQQLIDIGWELIARSPVLQKSRLQFRYSFSSGP